MLLSQTLAQIPDPLARWCRTSVCDGCEPHASAVFFLTCMAANTHPPRPLFFKAFILGTPSPIKHLFVLGSWRWDLSIKYRVLSTPFFPRDSSLSYPPYPIPVDGRSYNSKHTHLFACISILWNAFAQPNLTRVYLSRSSGKPE